MRYRTAWIFSLVLLGILIAGRAGAQTTNVINTGPVQVRLKTIATVSSSAAGAPNFGAHTGDPRFLYVGEQNGAVRTIDFGGATPVVLGTPFLDIGAVLGSTLLDDTGSGERGLLGASFHPDFNTAAAAGFRKFYTYTSETLASGGTITFTHPELGTGGNNQAVIREWTANAPNPNGIITVNTATPSRVLMRIRHPQGNHNGGGMAFGPDKFLYITSGDGGGGNDNSGGIASTTDGHTNSPGGNQAHGNGQDRTNVFGKILRIKPTIDVDANTTASANGQYRVPNDNPFAGATVGVDEIFAFGLRNPFRMSFDRSTGKGYVGDVGQSDAEEVNLLSNGGNFGWVIKEGFADNPGVPNYIEPAGLINPLAAYAGSQGDAVIGGYVYRGSLAPQLQGKFVFGDFRNPADNSGRLLYMDINEPGPNTVFQLNILTTLGGVAKPNALLHGVMEDANGEIYFLFSNGQVVQLIPEPSTWLLAAIGTMVVVGLKFKTSSPAKRRAMTLMG